jgi:hypothetical protein
MVSDCVHLRGAAKSGS